MATIYYEGDTDSTIISGRKVAVVGYGSQGHAHALNLRESGVEVRVGLRETSRRRAEAEGEGLTVGTVEEVRRLGRCRHDPRSRPNRCGPLCS